MKICLINNLYGPYARGGAEKIAEMTADGLAKKGHEVIIIATKPAFRRQTCVHRRQKVYYISSLFRDLNKLPAVFRLFWHIIDMFGIGSFLKVRTILKKEKPDIAITHNLKGIGYLIPLAVRLSGIKHIHILHDIQLIHPSGLMIYGKEKKIDGAFAKMYAVFCRLLFGSPALVVSPSRWLLDMHSKRGFFKNSKKMVMPNPINIVVQNSKFNPAKAGQNSKIFRFLYVGQIEEHKGILFLIKAFKKNNSPFNKGGVGGFLGLELLIVGGGSQIKKAEELARGNENIKFLGKKNKDEVMSLMRGADCLVVPSLCYENSPTVIYEAFAAGLPVLAADLGGIQELLANGAGILFNSGDEKDLADKIKWALENKDELKNVGEEGSRKVKNFSLESYLDKVLQL